MFGQDDSFWEVISSDSEEEDEVEHEQSGRGKKRKSDDRDEEPQQDYYRIKSTRDHYSQKFNMTAQNYSVRFNNQLDNVNLLESQKRTYGISTIY